MILLKMHKTGNSYYCHIKLVVFFENFPALLTVTAITFKNKVFVFVWNSTRVFVLLTETQHSK